MSGKSFKFYHISEIPMREGYSEYDPDYMEDMAKYISDTKPKWKSYIDCRLKNLGATSFNDLDKPYDISDFGEWLEGMVAEIKRDEP